MVPVSVAAIVNYFEKHALCSCSLSLSLTTMLLYPIARYLSRARAPYQLPRLASPRLASPRLASLRLATPLFLRSLRIGIMVRPSRAKRRCKFDSRAYLRETHICTLDALAVP